jgi:hypothetical protein
MLGIKAGRRSSMLKMIMVIALLACLFLFLAAEGKEGPAGAGAAGAPSSPETASAVSSGGGGGSGLPDIENFIRQVESWKANYKDRFEYLQKLMYKPAFTSTKYVPPAVWIYYSPSKNTSVNRTDNIEIKALILNTNPIEIRRALYLTLEIQEPGESNFKPAPRTGIQIIQVNEYDEKQNTSWRIFPELTSLKFLKEVGNLKFRIRWTDGEYTSDSSISNPAPGFYPVLPLKVKNIPPRINNSTMRLDPELARWDDYIRYLAYLEDIENSQDTSAIVGKDENPVQVTLHIFNGSNEVFSTQKQFLPGDMVSFSTRDVNGMFKEANAGNNFTYRYSCTDGIKGGDNTTWSAFGEGPHIKPNPKIKVSDPMMFCEDENYYWWQWYTFHMRVKNLNPVESDVVFTLYTKTGDNPWKWIEKKAVRVSQAPQVVYFNNTKPFIANDANALFSYSINFSEYDEEGKNSIEASGPRINPKLMPYAIYHPIMLFNWILVLVLVVGGCLFIERKLQRGIESQESSSLKSKVKKGKSEDRSSNDLFSKISKMIRRGDKK